MNIIKNRDGLELVKVDVIGAIPAVLLNLGLDPDSVIASGGLSPEIFDDPENAFSFMGLSRLMSESVKTTGCEHFGLLVGQRASTRSLGLVGLLVEHSPNVFAALENLVRYLHLQDGCGVPSVEVVNGTVLLGYRIVNTSVPGVLEIVDAAVAMRFNIMRRLCGKLWRPIEVALPRPKPQSTKPFDSFFGVPVRFGEEQGAIVFSADWSLRSVPGADPMIRSLVDERIKELDRQQGGNFETQLRRLIRTLVLTRRCSLKTVARQFAMEPRSFARRLEREGIEFRGVVDEVRYEIARHLIANVSLPITQVATILGYSEASALTRAFRRWSTTTPKSWRARQPARLRKIGSAGL